MSEPSSQLPDNGPSLPEMREALLDASDVRSLHADLSALTRITGVLCKQSIRSQSPLGDVHLDEAVERLLDRSLAAVQIRYQYEGRDWTDTLLNVPGGIRMVRCQH